MAPSQATSIQNYGVFRFLTRQGERLPVLIHLESGIPARLALRYALEQRDRGSSPRLEARLRRIGALYDWYASRLTLDLDALFLAGEAPRIQHLKRAVADFRRGDLLPDFKRPQVAARTLNACIRAWLDFLAFGMFPDLWRTGHHNDDDVHARQGRRDNLAEITEALQALRLPEPEFVSHEPLIPDDLRLLEIALFGPSSCFAAQALQRNRLIYRLIRFTGVRGGEALKIMLADLPPLESAGAVIERRLLQRARYLKIVRRPDDPEDPRLREARVKRGDRDIPIPDDLAEDLWEYAKGRGPSASPYLFVSSNDPAKPLSFSRLEDIAHQLSVAATKLAPTGRTVHLNWHRLRTTRAVEAVPEFFPGGKETHANTREFLHYFGWQTPDSAEPYLKSLRQSRRLSAAVSNVK